MGVRMGMGWGWGCTARGEGAEKRRRRLGWEAERKARRGSTDFLTATQWRQNQEALLQSSQRILEALRSLSRVGTQDQQAAPPAQEVLTTCFQQLSGSYDEEYGGFSQCPKFPTPGQCGPRG